MPNIDKYKHSGYVLDLIDLDFFHTLSSSTKIDNRKKDILILGKGPTLQFQIIVPPSSPLINFWIFLSDPLSYLDPPAY